MKVLQLGTKNWADIYQLSKDMKWQFNILAVEEEKSTKKKKMFLMML